MSAVDVTSSLAYVGGIAAAVVLTGLAVLNIWLAVRAVRWLRSALSGESVDLAASVKRAGRGGGGGSTGDDRMSVSGIAKTAVSGGFFAALMSSCSWF